MAFNGERPLQAGRTRLLLRVDRRAARPARERLDELRRNGLHARPADRLDRTWCEGAAGAGRLRRRPDPRPRADRQGARRRHRGVARPPRRGSTRVRDKQIPVLFYKSRYAERLPIGKPDILRSAPAAAAAGFYDDLVPARAHGLVVVGDVDAGRDRVDDPRRVRRHRRPRGRGAAATHLRGAARIAETAGERRRPIPRSPRPPCRSCASAPDSPRAAGGDYRRVARRRPGLADAERPVRRAVAQARRAIPRRRRVRGGPQPDGATVRPERARSKTASWRPGSRRSRSRRAGCRQFGFSGGRAGSRAVNARRSPLRARLQRARQERERLVRAGVPEPLPRRTSRAPASSTSIASPAGAARHHAAESATLATRRARRREPRRAGRRAAEGSGVTLPHGGRPARGPGRAPSAVARHAVERHDDDAAG